MRLDGFEISDLHAGTLPWPLLLEADPHGPHVETYLHRAVWLGLHERERLLAVAALVQDAAHTIELMNIAVEPTRRREGLGTRLLRAAIARARSMHARTMTVGTGNSSLDALAFYQRMGFRMQSIERDHFVRAYPLSIVENGIVCRDMVRLALSIEGRTGPAAAGETASHQAYC